ncbi:Zn2-C6 fungal-type domain-containing protein [Fusarium acuminatum]|uniref:Zn2-C6 fungal-type domain-containing protein n=1 Tax=Fusarium acuminatum TaxID=5515 RepID=A0ABZ2XE89_9HYPO
MDSQPSPLYKGATYPTKHRRNYPRSKSGCLTCRERRKKCDEVKPACNYCVKSSRVCTWPGQDNHCQGQLQSGLDNSGSDTNSNPNPASRPRCQIKQFMEKAQVRWNVYEKAGLAISISSQTQILKRFFFDWSNYGDVTSGYTMTWFGRLPQIYLNSSIDGLLHKSINALAYVSYGQRFNSHQALRDATRLYGEAIFKLKDEMLCIVDSSQYSEVMASIVLLGIYEGLLDQSIALEGSWVSHTSGGCTLLTLRGQDKIIESSTEYEVSIITFMQMIQIGLLTGQGLPTLWKSVQKLGLPRLPYFYTHTELIYQSACLCKEWRTALLNFEADQDITPLFDIISQALALDKHLEGWAKDILPSLHYTVEPVSTDSQLEWLQPLLDGPWKPLHSHTYPSLMNQVLWRFYWMVRAILNQALLFTNSIFEQAKVTTNPVILHKSEIESSILSFMDLLCESCLSTFTNIVKDDPQSYKVEAVPSLLGYLTLQVLPTVGLCLEQVNLTGIDLSGRKEWVAKIRDFLRVNLGIAKGAAAIPPSSHGDIPVQIWGLG